MLLFAESSAGDAALAVVKDRSPAQASTSTRAASGASSSAPCTVYITKVAASDPDTLSSGFSRITRLTSADEGLPIVSVKACNMRISLPGVEVSYEFSK